MMQKARYIIALLFLMAIVSGCHDSRVMQQKLLFADSLNRNYIPMDTLEWMKQVHDYYKKHGNRNEKITANYLLGCVYRDKGDMPRALEYYRNATEIADTTAKDCDFKQLSRIYGQIGYIFGEQRSPRLELKAYRNATKYAFQAKDTLAALLFYESQSDVYNLHGKRDSALIVNRTAHDLLIKYGYENVAASVSGALAPSVYLDRNDIANAERCLKEYEQKSGFFDKNGNVENGKEVYYFIKGKYYEQVGKLDSAILFYKKQQHYGYRISDLESSSKGLMSVYRKLGETDSVMKYARLFAQANDSANILESSDEITWMNSVYNYNESRRMADAKDRETQKYKTEVVTIIAVVIIGFLLFWTYMRKKKIEQKNLLAIKKAEYHSLQQQFTRAQEDMESAKMGLQHFQNEKQKEIEHLQALLNAYKEDEAIARHNNQHSETIKSDIIDQFHRLAAKAQTPSNTEWCEFTYLIPIKLDDFCNKIKSPEYNLNETEIIVAMLIRCDFVPNEIVTLLNLSKQRVTNIRASINKKMFQTNGTSKLDFHIKHL